MWKSDNKGDKEETFIQTSRRARDGQPGWRGPVARRWLADPARWQIVERDRQAAAGRPHKVVAGRPCGPTFVHR